MKHLLITLALAVTGCSITGTDSKSQFACQAPEGVQCMSTSGVYFNSLNNNLPSLRTNISTAADEAKENAGASKTLAVVAKPQAADFAMRLPDRGGLGRRGPDFSATGAVRAVPRVMRVWVLPWEDADGDLHDQSYLYMALDSGRWLIEHTKNGLQPHKLGGTTLLVGDTAMAKDGSNGDEAQSGFSRDVEKLAPAKPDVGKQ